MKIHQVYPDNNLPAEIKENVQRLKQMNPDWEYRLYTDEMMERYIRDHYPQLISTYLRISPRYGAARADFFRYLLIYREGGLYLDIKSSATRPLTEVLSDDDSFILAQWPNGPGDSFEGWGMCEELEMAGGEFMQWFIASEPGHPFIGRVIEQVVSNVNSYDACIDDVGFLGVLRVTGPIAYTRAIMPLLGSHPYRRVDVFKELGLVYSILVDENGRGHHHLFRKHYSRRTSLVVRQPLGKGLLMLARYRCRRLLGTM